MKNFLRALLVTLSLYGGAVSAQVVQESVSVQNFIPSGPCSVAPLVKVSNVGTYQCAAGVWTLVGPSSGQMVFPGVGVAVSTGTSWGTSLPLAGAGAGVVTGPTVATAGDLPVFTGTNGQLSDGIASSTLVTLTGTQSLSNKSFVAPVLGAATGTSLSVTGNINSSSGSIVGNNIGFGETAITSATTAINVGSQINTITLAANYAFTMAGTAATAGRQLCLVFVQPATGGPFTVTPPSNVKGFFAGNTGLIGTTAGLRNAQCFVFSNSLGAWIPTSGGVVNF